MVKEMTKYYSFMLLAVLLSSFSQILLKKSARSKHNSIIKEYLNIYVIGGYGMMLISTLLIIWAYQRLEYKNGPIIESLGFILVMVLSYLFFRERVGLRKILGYTLILFGVIVFYI